MMALKYICDRLQDYNINFFVNELVEASKNLGILQAKIDAYKFNSILIPMFHRKEVMSSMDIEGTQRTTLSDICEREVDPKLHDEKESIEIRNHTKALIFGAEHLRANKFTHSFIQEVHKIMLTDVEPPNPDKPIGKRLTGKTARVLSRQQKSSLKAFASKELFLTARIACFEVALQFTRYDPRDPVPEGTAGGLASERWSYTFDSAVSIK